jgi:hypothetical protein
MKNDKKSEVIEALMCFLFIATAFLWIYFMLSKEVPQKIDYQLEIVDENHIKLMDENGKSLYITTFDSIGYYIEQDNL